MSFKWSFWNYMQEFSSYFNDWLYGEDGYYSKYKSIGKSGDFYTAVSTSMFLVALLLKK